MKKLAGGIRHFLVSEDGPTAVEYALMVALIAVAIIATVTTLGESLKTKFGQVSTKLDAVAP